MLASRSEAVVSLQLLALIAHSCCLPRLPLLQAQGSQITHPFCVKCRKNSADLLQALFGSLQILGKFELVNSSITLGSLV